ncbi:MarR family winged helix-turn-helix transcriptional regulator [Chryseobacterium capnotolerans]|uniref:MarR family winged helix-turn-helix transcriptional regulator n=1 Tax=Chryseobacterium capnotolerans TaxID=2759528 RepID=UPI001E46CDD1|nr:helix-turn-helix domain-containing protein [Chryseobacterium capnotolerans]
MIKDILHQFRVASRQYSDASLFMHEAIARKAGLSSADHKYLGLILQYDSITAGDISKLTGLTTGAVTGLIDRLKKKNFLKGNSLKRIEEKF